MIDDTQLLQCLGEAGDAVPIFIALGNDFSEIDQAVVSNTISELCSEEQIELNVRVLRTYTILIHFVLKVSIIVDILV